MLLFSHSFTMRSTNLQNMSCPTRVNSQIFRICYEEWMIIRDLGNHPIKVLFDIFNFFFWDKQEQNVSLVKCSKYFYGLILSSFWKELFFFFLQIVSVDFFLNVTWIELNLSFILDSVIVWSYLTAVRRNGLHWV